MNQITFRIDGMRCSMCEAHIADAIRRGLPQAKKVKANHHKGVATFLLEEGLDHAPAVASIEAGGYRVLDVEVDEQKSHFFFRKK